MNRFTEFVYPLAGFLLITAGATWIYHPLGPITAGMMLLTAAFLGKKRNA